MWERSYLLLSKSILEAEHGGEVGNVSYMLLLDSNERISFGWRNSLILLETFLLYFQVIIPPVHSGLFSVSVSIKWGVASFPFATYIFAIGGMGIFSCIRLSSSKNIGNSSWESPWCLAALSYIIFYEFLNQKFFHRIHSPQLKTEF